MISYAMAKNLPVLRQDAAFLGGKGYLVYLLALVLRVKDVWAAQ
jgi:hypothetical protein